MARLTLERVALVTSSLLYITATSAQTVIPLTDPGISFTGNAHYNTSLCGGAIYLPDIGDSISFNFTGSDFQITAIIGGKSDTRKNTVLPEQTEGYAYYEFLSRSFPDCSETEDERWSTPRHKQLPLGPHTVIIQNVGNATDKGTGVLIGALQFYPSPLPDLPTYTPTSQSSKSKKNHTGAIVGGAVGGVVFLAAVIVAGLFLWKPSFRQRFIGKKPAEGPKALLTGRSLSSAGASRSSVRMSREEQRTDASQPRMVEQAPLLAAGFANSRTDINSPRVSSEAAPNRS
ncbi:hypothetical protein FRC01_008649 [Tulasnella sp. 417]|nr:hypothetical protein FRC01_008649 [Tulasnella sp. 417]